MNKNKKISGYVGDPEPDRKKTSAIVTFFGNMSKNILPRNTRVTRAKQSVNPTSQYTVTSKASNNNNTNNSRKSKAHSPQPQAMGSGRANPSGGRKPDRPVRPMLRKEDIDMGIGASVITVDPYAPVRVEQPDGKTVNVGIPTGIGKWMELRDGSTGVSKHVFLNTETQIFSSKIRLRDVQLTFPDAQLPREASDDWVLQINKDGRKFFRSMQRAKAQYAFPTGYEHILMMLPYFDDDLDNDNQHAMKLDIDLSSTAKLVNRPTQAAKNSSAKKVRVTTIDFLEAVPLSDVLANTVTVAAFHRYLVAVVAEENLLFYGACEIFEKGEWHGQTVLGGETAIPMPELDIRYLMSSPSFTKARGPLSVRNVLRTNPLPTPPQNTNIGRVGAEDSRITAFTDNSASDGDADVGELSDKDPHGNIEGMFPNQFKDSAKNNSNNAFKRENKMMGMMRQNSSLRNFQTDEGQVSLYHQLKETRASVRMGLASADGKPLPLRSMKDRALVIWEKFMKPGSELWVCVSDTVATNIKRKIDAANETTNLMGLFKRAQEEVYNNMADVLFPAFIEAVIDLNPTKGFEVDSITRVSVFDLFKAKTNKITIADVDV